MYDLNKLQAICRIPVGREISFERDGVISARVDKARLRRACDGVTARTGAIFEIRKTRNHFIVRRIAEAKSRSGVEQGEREASTWLLPERIENLYPSQRAHRIGQAFTCLRRVSRVTGEEVEDIAARLGLDTKLLMEDGRFGKMDFERIERRARGDLT